MRNSWVIHDHSMFKKNLILREASDKIYTISLCALGGLAREEWNDIDKSMTRYFPHRDGAIRAKEKLHLCLRESWYSRLSCKNMLHLVPGSNSLLSLRPWRLRTECPQEWRIHYIHERHGGQGQPWGQGRTGLWDCCALEALPQNERCRNHEPWVKYLKHRGHDCYHSKSEQVTTHKG